MEQKSHVPVRATFCSFFVCCARVFFVFFCIRSLPKIFTFLSLFFFVILLHQKEDREGLKVKWSKNLMCR